MALSGWEWIVIGVIAIVIILWGPQKIPELARAFGRAKGEFDKASKEYETAAKEVTDPANYPPRQTQTTANKKDDDVLIETAKKLGISTQGKTREEISTEVAEKIKALSGNPQTV